MDTHQSSLEFPCVFPLKVLGINSNELIAAIVAIISANSPDFNPDKDLTIKPSKKNNYISITANIIAKSQEQLDDIYLAINKHELVKLTL